MDFCLYYLYFSLTEFKAGCIFSSFSHGNWSCGSSSNLSCSDYSSWTLKHLFLTLKSFSFHWIIYLKRDTKDSRNCRFLSSLLCDEDEIILAGTTPARKISTLILNAWKSCAPGMCFRWLAHLCNYFDMAVRRYSCVFQHSIAVALFSQIYAKHIWINYDFISCSVS